MNLKPFKVARALAIHAAIAALAWCALSTSAPEHLRAGSANLLIWLSWLIAVGAVASVKSPGVLPGWFAGTFGGLMVGFLVWAGWWATAFAWLIFTATASAPKKKPARDTSQEMTITRLQLCAALLLLDRLHGVGGCMSPENTAGKSTTEIRAARARYLWEELEHLGSKDRARAQGAKA